MKKIYILLMIALFAQNLMAAKTVLVTLDYAEKKALEIVKVEFTEGMTALELLQRAAKISIKKAGKFNFVRSINGVQSHSKSRGWFYQIDGKDAEKMACDNVLGDIKTMKWEFKIANCGT